MTEATTEVHRRILVADDNEEYLAILQHCLSGQGYTVEVARSGTECLQRIQESLPSLLVLDLMMPEIHGVQVLQTIRQDARTRDLPVIVCSASDYRPERQATEELGIVDFIAKPFLPSELRNRIQEYFQGTDGTLTGSSPELRSSPRQSVWLPRLKRPTSYLRFWGTRGSVPVSGRPYLFHGGDTSCVEIRHEDDLILFDAGTGIRSLGNELMRGGPRRIHLFITHTHWDHIQGFPFFAPAFSPEFEITVYGAPGFKKDLHAIFRGQLDADYFPVQFEDLRARIEFRMLDRPWIEIGPVTVGWEFVPHPGPAVGFKLEAGGKTLAYVSDSEFAKGYLGDPADLSPDHPVVLSYGRLVDFLDGVDLLIHEAQYTNTEYPSKIGWGHSSVSNACALARLARVPRWILTHHDPAHSDEQLTEQLLMVRQILGELGAYTRADLAFDGLIETLWTPVP